MNFNQKIRTTFLILSLGIFFGSCISNVEEELEEPPVDAKVSFKDAVKPIIDGRCISCHGAGGNSPELTSYATISANASSVKNEVASGRMPQGTTLTPAQIKTIVDWVDEGALDN
ncbi:cytochrome c [uncultured Polaribacter sp.]|uniref:c-type cytochrome n=1 Tax=uncultured Polaribacter sp. TaxID=174711 RepID=UPI0026267F9B|nr:cytochrome c [uncultured Polaribacter sp.]